MAIGVSHGSALAVQFMHLSQGLHGIALQLGYMPIVGQCAGV
jgi:hypothetical protein